MSRELEAVRRRTSQPPVDIFGLIRDLGIRFDRRVLPRGKSGYIEHN